MNGFSKNVGICNVIIENFWGVVEGLSFANSQGYTWIKLKDDS